MNNLLKTISESHVHSLLPDADLKLLLSSVSHIRSQDTKAADPFYASLESVLQELRTVTPDSRDAEAFLRPVPKSDYPDYYEVIKHPMDLGTMLKSVKARKYKTKQEFADDLNLIWKNCFKYNNGPEHVLRGCATRLRRKAEHLLAHVSDRPDNITINGLPKPSVPPPTGLPATNGAVKEHMSSPEPTTPHLGVTPNTPGPSYSKSPHSVSGQSSVMKQSPSSCHGSSIPFEDQPALIRTSSAMALFRGLDTEIMSAMGFASIDAVFSSDDALTDDRRDHLIERLYNIIDSDAEVNDESHVGNHLLEGSHSERILKRRRLSSGSDSRKRMRLAESCPIVEPSTPAAELLGLWWKVVNKDVLLTGGIPPLPASTTVDSKVQKSAKHSLIAEHPHKKDRRKKRTKPARTENSLLTLMNRNISTLSRIRRTHSKFLILNTSTDPNNQSGPVLLEPPSDIDADGESPIDEAGWKIKGEVEQQSADDCLHWMTGKILQHAGFQGSSTSSLNVLTSVVSEYLQNVGRTIRFLCDRYSRTMSAEEIILHTLFEGGISEIQDLERYIKDDIIRYGVRLTELEKKLVSAYREVTSVDEPNYENMLEAEGEADMFLSGVLSDVLGNAEDFLGLRELGIEAEYGLKSLSVPRRLLRGKDSEDRTSADRAHTGIPSLPYPPPPSFIPLEASKVDSQIGLLKDFYQSRFVHLLPSTQSLPLQSDTTGLSTLHSTEGFSRPSTSSQISTSFSHVPPSTVLPDDLPSLARAKLGPLGQVIHVNPATASSKKKGKGKESMNESKTEMEAMAKKETKKKKPAQDLPEGASEGNPGIAEVNGTGPKKKAKSTGAKKPINGTGNSTLDVPPTIVASA